GKLRRALRADGALEERDAVRAHAAPTLELDDAVGVGGAEGARRAARVARIAILGRHLLVNDDAAAAVLHRRGEAEDALPAVGELGDVLALEVDGRRAEAAPVRAADLRAQQAIADHRHQARDAQAGRRRFLVALAHVGRRVFVLVLLRAALAVGHQDLLAT